MLEVLSDMPNNLQTNTIHGQNTISKPDKNGSNISERVSIHTNNLRRSPVSLDKHPLNLWGGENL